MSPRFRVWAEIDCQALRQNIRTLRGHLPAGTKLMAVLKANAYGHGAIACSQVLQSEGVDAIGVGDSQEAIELRTHGVRAPVLILGAVIPGEMPDVIANNIQINLHSLAMAREANDTAKSIGRIADVQLLIDTGMGRLGAQPHEAPAILDAFADLKHLRLRGICTHFSSPGEADPTFTQLQLTRFKGVVDLAIARGHRDLLVHAASHCAMLKFPEAAFKMVRPGLALWGITQAGPHRVNNELRRVLSLKTQVVHVKDVPQGTPIGYSRLWHAPKDTRIATLPIGYNDGFPIALTGKANVLIGGQRCPVVGRVSMDYIMVDVGHLPQCSIGDVVTVIGRDGFEEIKVEDVAGALGTIPYEVTCRLGRRVKRVFTNQHEQLLLSGRYGVVIPERYLVENRPAAA